MNTVFKNLHIEMIRFEETSSEIATLLGLKKSTVYKKMTGKSNWTIDEACKLCEHYDRPFEYLFSKNLENIYTPLKYDDFKQYEIPGVKPGVYKPGLRYKFRFKNGYGASVVKHGASYGSEDDLFEVAVLKFDDKGECYLYYDTPIMNDVMGYLNNYQVLKVLDKINKLKAR